MPRKSLDGAKLAKDVTRLLGEDQVSPPRARPSLMDAVRALATYIETRARLGWTDPMIARVLAEAGYPIDAATLRSYRKRLRDEGLMGPLPVRKTRSAAPAEKRPTQHQLDVAATAFPVASPADAAVTAAADDVPASIPPAEVSADAAPRAPPPSSTAAPAPAMPGRTFRNNPTTLPPNRV
ncbi:hypothetical protein [uncultured Sphingomonas sp.]|uniref:hypothetical protein n=1 Tax=uncultured Sphingomonas sp. TaxID=158754 RepID=UPI00374A071E